MLESLFESTKEQRLIQLQDDRHYSIGGLDIYKSWLVSIN
jgi:hypothetical protein